MSMYILISVTPICKYWLATLCPVFRSLPWANLCPMKPSFGLTSLSFQLAAQKNLPALQASNMQFRNMSTNTQIEECYQKVKRKLFFFLKIKDTLLILILRLSPIINFFCLFFFFFNWIIYRWQKWDNWKYINSFLIEITPTVAGW